METRAKRNIRSGMEYNPLFPVADLGERTVKKGATVSDTVKFIPKVVHQTLLQTKAIAEKLRGSTVSETCRNIWHFVYDHIAYYKDDEGKEQIRSPARTWHDRSRGVDCDCYTVFISSILTNLKIPHRLRIAKYKQDHFQHIYPVVPRGGRHITIDCVVEHFNYEEPYTEIKDTTMDLEYLSGLDDLTENEFSGDDDEMGKLKLFKKKAASGSTSPSPKKGVFKKFIGKALNVVNKVNPATVLLRNGVMAAMKLNLMNVAGRLKYAYLSDAEAQKRNIDMGKFQKLKQVKDKLEKIFFGAGGKPENLKNAILTGKGNKNKEVSGLGYAFPENNLWEMDESTPLPQLLGDGVYQSENIEGTEELGELGEPVTAASITAASGAIASLAALLTGIGNIFKKKEKGSEDFESSGGDSATNLPAEIEKNKEEISKMDVPSDESDSSSTTSETSKTSDSSSTDSSSDDSKKEGFWDKNKKWLKPTLWGAGGLTLLALGYKMLSGKKEEAPPVKTLSGTKKKKPKNKMEEKALM